jgi:hypothetical protein
MSETEERLAKIEERLTQIELGVPGAPPPAPPPHVPQPSQRPLVSLAFWLGVTLLGAAIWVLSNRLK